ncbi:MAG TPA: hypothetical protein VNS32_24065 [Flavisolibacter sp.]|nr:hypothetical protein [Flavisolibacter sp.]
METQFYILITLKTPQGLDNFGKFFIGNNRDRAYTLFDNLKGTDNASEKDLLFFDFMETASGLPLNLKMKSCTLNQLAENCKLITKELFKVNNMIEF